VRIGQHMVAAHDGERWRVTTKNGVTLLGHIEWYARWSQFEFLPVLGAAFTSDCLRAMAGRLDQLTADRVRAQAVQR
jgi:hypothetical protein